MTAVEFAIEKLAKFIPSGNQLVIHIILQEAKELEKQQMESCAIFFTKYAIDKIENKTNLKGEEQFEQYYNETFNK